MTETIEIVKKKPRRRKWLRRLVISGVVLVLLWLGSSIFVAYMLTHRAHGVFAEPVPSVTWAKFEEVRLTTEDGESIGGWYAAGPARAPVVLILHGNGGCRSACLGLAQFYAGEGFSTLLISMRAHGDSSGERNDVGYSARHDVEAAVKWLVDRDGDRAILIHGESLGSAAAIYAAAQMPRQVRGYVLECPYRDIYTAVSNRVENYLPWPLDRVAYAGLMTVAPVFLPEAGKMAPIDYIGGISKDVPVLILAGGADRHARPEEAREMLGKIAEHGRLVVIPGAGHTQLAATDPELYWATLREYLRTFKRD